MNRFAYIPRHRAAITLSVCLVLQSIAYICTRGGCDRSPLRPTSATITTSPEENNVFKLVLLTEAAKSKGAVCLDGSPGAYYIRRPVANNNQTSSNNKFLIFHQGGGWCSSPTNCLDRSSMSLGSSTSYPPTVDAKDSKSLAGVALYEYLKDYTIIYAKYCDGSSWSGNVDEPVLVYNETSQRNETIYYRGRRLLDALFADLLANQGLGDADVLLYGGCSAGALASYLHIDYVRTLLSPSTKLAGLADSMFALPYRSFTRPQSSFQKLIQWGYSAWNSSSSINDRCQQHFVSDRPEDAYMCMYGAVGVNFVETPMLIVNSKYDTWQQVAMLELTNEYCDPKVDTDGTVIPCGDASPGAEARDRFWHIYASEMVRTVEEEVPLRHGAFLSNCPFHALIGWVNWRDTAGPDNRLNDALAKWVDLLEAGNINNTMSAPRWIAKENDKCFGQQ